MEQNLLEEQSADYQAYTVSGSHEEIGRQTALQGRFPINGPMVLTPEQREYAHKCRDLVEEIYPEIIEECRGYAAALDLTEDQWLWHLTLGVQGGCSAIALLTPEGMLVGRNYDYYYFENRRHLIQTRPEKGYSHIGMHEGLIGGRFDGLNEHGLFVSFNGAGQHPDPAQPGMSFHLIVRYLLETCRSAEEALKRLLKLPVKEPKSYFLADPGTAYVAEVHMDHRAVRTLEDGLLVVTNHFIHPEMRSYQPEWPNSSQRYRKLCEQGAEILRTSEHPLSSMQALLSDHDAPVCGHRDGMATFWSCTANLNQGQIFYSLGAPCRNPYQSPIQRMTV
ncbi:C45 family autoproteolytic acyltransferase/hydolase [Paenibacillus chibensis]|uniref:C45 family autoproteolytic acyltransferase/hydolase n=1 Tax=Paenibacillus chibensis TaxID=59846 RepID=UPI000FDCCA87|nr:C45 family peptidase [Paenibacillus chibensis]MEC0370585.1 C45 family autoproteolytic acyltransferase/hydrolase [Paenibacillus chibensis]